MSQSNEWISVEDRLPDYDHYVLWHKKDGLMFVDCLDKDGNGFLKGYDTDMDELFPDHWVTHWRELPQPPK